MLYRHYHTLQRRLASDEHDLDQRFDAIMARLDAQDQQRAEQRRPSRRSRLATAVSRRRTLGAARGAFAGGAAIAVAKVAHVTQGALSLVIAIAAGSATAALVVALTDVRSVKKLPRRQHRERNDVPASAP
ncbi:hypothetical protein OG226_51225 [Streptomyces sp. NBC_01261]|uniref:hypothetical protein n=1 Tax=Streptomyces sp. NBC_01261 TaxID=2903802 RepID=UPI002E35D823|nr:hypothetical protein [Streptomyces sp. NBC_01261]